MDKTQVDQILDQYDEIEQSSNQSRNTLNFFGCIFVELLSLILALSLFLTSLEIVSD